MTRITSSQDEARIESIYRAAEQNAVVLRGGLPVLAEAEDLRPIAESSLAREAAIECERLLVRKRFMPGDLSAEWAWTILLDVWVNEQHAGGMKLSHLASKRGLSALTTARQVAALIEYGLIKRVPQITDSRDSDFRTTYIGRQIFSQIMNYFSNITVINSE